MPEGSLFSVSLPTLVISCVFDNRHSSRYEMIFHCGFDFHFSNSVIEQPFKPVGHLYVFFKNMFIQFLGSFFKLGFCFAFEFEFFIYFIY